MRGGSRGVGVLLVAVAAWHLVALLDDEVALREAHLGNGGCGVWDVGSRDGELLDDEVALRERHLYKVEGDAG